MTNDSDRTWEEDPQSASNESSEIECARCGCREMLGETGLRIEKMSHARLCGRCLRTMAPALWSHVENAGEITETVELPEFSIIALFNNMLGRTFFAGSTILTAFVLAVHSWRATVATWRVIGVPVIVVSSLLLARLYRKRRREGAARLPRRISIKNGRLVIQWKSEAISLRLADCQWYEGSNGLDADFELQPMSSQAIVICSKDAGVACGQTAEMRQVLRELMLVSRIQRKVWCSFRTVALVALSGSVTTWLTGGLIGRVIARVANNANWDKFLPFSLTIWGAAASLYCVAVYINAPKGARTTWKTLAIFGIPLSVVLSGPRWFDVGVAGFGVLLILIALLSVPASLAAEFLSKRAALKAEREVVQFHRVVGSS